MRNMGFLAFCLVASSASAWPRAAQDTAEDERTFFRPLAEVLQRAEGTRLAFRFRHLEFAGRVEDGPSKMRDGVMRIAFQGDSVQIEEICAESSVDRDPIPVLRRVETIWSIASGEYARQFHHYGGSPSVVLDHALGLPPIVFFSLGMAGLPAALNSGEIAERRIDDAGLATAMYRSAEGASIRLEFDPIDGGRLHSIEAQAPGNAQRDWVHFYDWVPLLAGGPARPTLLTEARVEPDGTVREVTAWSSIGGAWAEESWSPSVASGTQVMDYRRAPGESGSGILTSRPQALADLLFWPVLQPEAAEPVHKVFPETQGSPDGARRLPLHTWTLAAVAALALTLAFRSRKS
jgi:hypothetical protein